MDSSTVNFLVKPSQGRWCQKLRDGFRNKRRKIFIDGETRQNDPYAALHLNHF